MIADDFSEWTRANMEVALERACKTLGDAGEAHQYRKFVARQMVLAAQQGSMTLAQLTQAAELAARELKRGHRSRALRKPIGT